MHLYYIFHRKNESPENDRCQYRIDFQLQQNDLVWNVLVRKTTGGSLNPGVVNLQ